MKLRILPLVLALGATACATEADDEAFDVDAEALDVNAKTQSVCLIGVRAAFAQQDGHTTRLVVDTAGCGLSGQLDFLLSPTSTMDAPVVDLGGEVERHGEYAHDAHGVWGRSNTSQELGYLHVMISDEGDVVAELAGDALFDAEGYPYRFDGELWVVR